VARFLFYHDAPLTLLHCQGLKFAWFLGHLAVLYFGVQYYLWYFFDSAYAASYYPWALVGALFSYAAVLFRSHETQPPSSNIALRMLRDDNVQYAGLVLIWLLSAPVFVTLVPFLMFSAFHSVTYLCKTFIPNLLRDPAIPANSGDQPRAVKAAYYCDSQMRRWYGPAMQNVSFWEANVISSWLIIDYILSHLSITEGSSILTLLAYGNFLALRYGTSGYTRESFAQSRAALDSLLSGTPVDPLYGVVKQRLAGFGAIAVQVLQSGQPQPPQ
jgi:hypothetical protein